MSIQTKIDGFRAIFRFQNRWKLLLERLFFRKEKISIYRYKGLEVLIDHSAGDANGAREVLVTDMYRRFFPFIDRRTNLNVLDVGANNGGFPLLLESEGFQLKKLGSVEMHPSTFSRMRFNIERNIHCIFQPMQVALVGVSRELEVAFGKGNVGDSIYRSKNDKNLTLTKISGRSFDEIYDSVFAGEVVDICKIDVEGAEFEMISAGTCERLSDCRYIIIEIHENKEHFRTDVLGKFASLGFVEIDGVNKNEAGVHYVHFLRNSRSE